MPTFWIARAAKLAQFLSGLVILLEIVGPERVDMAAHSITNWLRTAATSRSLDIRQHEVWLAFKYFILGMVAGFTMNHKKEMYYSQKTRNLKYSDAVFRVAFAIGTLSVISYAVLLSLGLNIDPAFIQRFQIQDPVFVKIVLFPIVFVYGGFFTFIAAYLGLVFPILIVFIILRPLEWIVDKLAYFIVAILEKRGLARVLLVMACLFLTLGFALELMAS